MSSIPHASMFEHSAALTRQTQLRRQRLQKTLLRLLLLGTVVVLALPPARGHSELLGWLPLWLVGMPASALWALLGFRLPQWPKRLRARSHRTRPQARRHRTGSVRLPRAA